MRACSIVGTTISRRYGCVIELQFRVGWWSDTQMNRLPFKLHWLDSKEFVVSSNEDLRADDEEDQGKEGD
jgi:hypothetical protein